MKSYCCEMKQLIYTRKKIITYNHIHIHIQNNKQTKNTFAYSYLQIRVVNKSEIEEMRIISLKSKIFCTKM